jgi:hypothetical protein
MTNIDYFAVKNNVTKIFTTLGRPMGTQESELVYLEQLLIHRWDIAIGAHKLENLVNKAS